MKKLHTARLGFVAGIALMGYGAGLVSVQPSNADDNKTERRGFGGGPTGPDLDRDGDIDGPDGGPGGGRGGRGMRGPGGPGGPGGRGMFGPGADGKAVGPMLHDLLDDLDLTDAQQKKIEDVQDKERNQMESLRKQMQEIQKKSRSNIDSILTADQRKQLEQAEKEMMQDGPRGGRGGDRMGDRRGGGGRDGGRDGGPGGDRFDDEGPGRDDGGRSGRRGQ